MCVRVCIVRWLLNTDFTPPVLLLVSILGSFAFVLVCLSVLSCLLSVLIVDCLLIVDCQLIVDCLLIVGLLSVQLRE